MLENKLGDYISDSMTPQEFTVKIESIRSKHSMSYVDAIVHYCEEIDIEVESVVSMIDVTLKAKVELEASAVNCVPKVNCLPF